MALFEQNFSYWKIFREYIFIMFHNLIFSNKISLKLII